MFGLGEVKTYEIELDDELTDIWNVAMREVKNTLITVGVVLAGYMVWQYIVDHVKVRKLESFTGQLLEIKTAVPEWVKQASAPDAKLNEEVE